METILSVLLTYWFYFLLILAVVAVVVLTLAMTEQGHANMKNALQVAWVTIRTFLTWRWTKKLLYWLIISAGTMAECAFLLASLWMSINSSVHPLVRILMSEAMTTNISYIATAAYVALPECILGLAVVTVITHVRMYLYTKENISLVWSILFGLPTLVFLVLSLITLGCSVVSVNFVMPLPLIVTRALAGYVFAFASLLHNQLGEPQEKDRLEQKDRMIAALQQENEQNLEILRQEKDAIIADLRRGVENQKELLAAYKNRNDQLQKSVIKSDEDALQAYSEDCTKWLKSGIKTVSPDEITRYTGHSKRKIDGAINKGYLQVAPRNKELILVSSLSEWLKHTPPPVAKTEQNAEPILHIVNG